MIIAIDASRAVKPNPTGIEVYSARIIEYLAKIDTTNTYWLYSPTPPPADFPQLPPNWQWKIIPFPRFWTQIRLSLALLMDHPDLLFVPAHVLPLYLPSKSVVTIHDLAYEVFPESYTAFERWYLRYASKQAIKRASKIITPSQSTRQDLIRLNQAPADKVVAIHLGFDQPVTKAKIPDHMAKLKPFFLMVGRLEKRKNTTHVIQAFAQLRKQQPGLKPKLILIGKPGYGYFEIETVISQLPDYIKKDIITLGYVSDTDLSAYRQAATALVYPSLYEGFGLPLLEAMAANLPIIASDISSIPEVVDDAAIMVDPESVDEIAKAMTILATNDLSGKEIVKRGRERLKQFSWEKTATATHQVLMEALQ